MLDMMQTTPPQPPTPSISQKTPEAVASIGKRGFNLLALVRDGRIPPPRKDSSGHYWWSSADIENARRAFEKSQSRRRQQPAGAV